MTPARSTTTTRRTARRPFKGRTKVALGLLLFMGVAGLVVWRRSIGVGRANEMRALEAKRVELVTARVTLKRNIDEASSRRRVVPLAERRLGMHVATESQSRVLADTTGRAP